MRGTLFFLSVGLLSLKALTNPVPEAAAGAGPDISHLFDMDITDDEGTDLSHLVTVHHHSNATALHNLETRKSRTIHPIRCDPVIDGHQYIFIASRCNRLLGPRAYTCRSFYADPYDFFFDDAPGSCNQAEVCVDIGRLRGSPIAACYPIDGYKPFKPSQHPAVAIDAKTYIGQSGLESTYVEAIWTDNSVEVGLTPTDMTLTAQRSSVDIHHHFQNIRTVTTVGQYSLEMTPVPEYTVRFVVKAHVPKGFAGGKLFIANS